MNDMIFDFERYDFGVSRGETKEGNIEYRVAVTDMMKDIQPFFHAAADHYEGSLQINYLFNEGVESPFHDTNEKKNSFISVYPRKIGDKQWKVRVEWTGSVFSLPL